MAEQLHVWDPNATCQEDSVSTKPASTSSSTSRRASSIGNTTPTEAATTLENLSLSIIRIVADRDFDNHNLRYLTRDFVANNDYFASGPNVTRDMQIAWWKRVIGRNPDYRLEPVRAVADVRGRDEASCLGAEEVEAADVWVMMNVYGSDGKYWKEEVLKFCWKRREGSWRCWKMSGMRGVAGGFV